MVIIFHNMIGHFQAGSLGNSATLTVIQTYIQDLVPHEFSLLCLRIMNWRPAPSIHAVKSNNK